MDIRNESRKYLNNSKTMWEVKIRIKETELLDSDLYQ